MYYHFRKNRQKYNSFPKSDVCHFCQPGVHTKPPVKETEHAYVVANRTFYDLWELRDVVDHLLLVPRAHVLQLQDLDTASRKDIIDLMAEYEAKGYEVYARSPESVSRSIPHQHTHLIKTDHREGRGMLYWRKPYIVWRIR